MAGCRDRFGWLLLVESSLASMFLHQRVSGVAAALMVLLVSSCSSEKATRSSQSGESAKPAVEQPQQATEQEDRKPVAQSIEGRATWYGPGLYGNKTTSGDVLQKGTLTAAHSSLPLGTEVKVTRLDTNESVTVTINDRKPYKPGTVIDLAHGAAEVLDLDDDGVAEVRVDVIE